MSGVLDVGFMLDFVVSGESLVDVAAWFDLEPSTVAAIARRYGLDVPRFPSPGDLDPDEVETP